MRKLFIDTSAKLANVFVIENERLLSFGIDNGEKTHASNLLPLIDKALCDAGMKLADVDVIGVTAGPGSYTGLRIGVSCGKMLAYGAGKPLVTINTLDFLAFSGFGALTDGAEEGDIVIPLIDARNTLCFYSAFRVKDGKLNAVSDVRSDYIGDIAAFAEKLRSGGNDDLPAGNTKTTAKIIFCGDGALRNRDALESDLGKTAFPDDKDVTGNYKGALTAVAAEIEAAGGDLSGFTPEKACANYYKEVHVTLKGN